ncbi:PREDICTED: 28S ribosomal protein S7, mitochondrial-like [Priapulus caudatus]|uniref:28S ribosomal protein S7, mitochondrial-like n=1 Tax=Priapulus caudatus TaxID=37621 RepID=A0ABM1ED92_PRICU|nr:PREDICTED: 28S ribosomal protein S7, mitochondrial-like [Priapulus caudatus]
MALPSAIAKFYSVLSKQHIGCYFSAQITHVRWSMYNPMYRNPIVSKEDLEEPLPKEDERNYLPIRAAKNEDNIFPHYDSKVTKFTNMIMKHSNKSLTRQLILRTFTQIKRTQLAKYHAAPDDMRSSVECNPVTIFHMAIENCKPLLVLQSVKRGAVTYQVPIPVREKEREFLAMQWLREVCRDKHRTVHMDIRLAQELIDASENTGMTVKRKQDLHRQAEANRAYAHMRLGR